MRGSLIIVVGRAGSGKSTLIAHTLPLFDSLEYLKTTTTRTPRSKDESYTSFEYEFVDQEEYAERQRVSPEWDHSKIYGNSYGCDTEQFKRKLHTGTSLIICTIPSEKEIDNLKKIYALHSEHCYTIFINTPTQETVAIMSGERPLGELHRIHQDNERPMHEISYDVIFDPIRDIDRDCAKFSEIIAQMLT